MTRSYDGPRVPSTGSPEFAMVGVNRPGGGVRLYASRDLPEHKLRWGLEQDRYHNATGWHIDAEMRRVLIIDKPTWGEAFAHAWLIWGNEDRERQRKFIEDGERAARVRQMQAARHARVLTREAELAIEAPSGKPCERHGEVGCAWCIPGPGDG